MAVSRKTQKDVGKYEAKFIGPFTSRESIFIGIGAVVCTIIGVLLSVLGFDYISIAIVVVIAMTPFVWLGKATPYGMRADDFLKEYYEYHIRRPSKRPYKTETTLDEIEWTEPVQLDEKGKPITETVEPHKKDADYPDYE